MLLLLGGDDIIYGEINYYRLKIAISQVTFATSTTDNHVSHDI